MELRKYQKDAIEKILWSMRENLEGNDLVVLPTGAGKSVVIANLIEGMDEPILILQPSKEILEQNYSKLLQYVDREKIGIYSASMKEKVVKQFTFATIQSIHRHPEEFKHFKLVIIDEAHLVNPKSLNGMYSSFLEAIGHPKCIGLTATPYRMDVSYQREDNGQLWAYTTTKLINRMKGFFWKRILFNMSTQELIDMGYLCKLQYEDQNFIEHEEIPTNISRSEFNLEAFEKIASSKVVKIQFAVSYAQSVSKSVLIFCSSVKQAVDLSNKIEGASVVTAKTPAKERTRIIQAFKNHEIKTVLNVGVLTTGFDHPSLDCIILLRPTRSIGLYYQMIGRGLRIAEGKEFCRIIDMTSTVKNLGRVETIRLEKQDKWELVSESGSWHNKPIFKFEMKPREKQGTLMN